MLVICPSCGREAPDDARTCPNCGASLDPATEQAEGPFQAVHTPPDEPEGEGHHTEEDLGRTLGATADTGAGAVRALLFGALVFLVVLLLALVVAFAAFLTGDASIGDVARIGGLLFFAFHHTGIGADVSTFDLSEVPGFGGTGLPTDIPVGSFEISFTVSVALLLGTLLAALLLYRAGRRAADVGGGTLRVRVLQGALVAVPYAVLAAGLAALVSFTVEGPVEVEAVTGELSLSPSLLSAFLWPLVIAALAGGLGGLASARPDPASAEPTRLHPILLGGVRMLLGILAAGLVGLLVLAALSPDLTSAYLEQVGQGREGLRLLLATVLGLPNLALWGLTVGLGGSVVAGEYLGGDSVTLAALFEFPEAADPGIVAGGLGVGQAPGQLQYGMAPVGYYVFIPLALIGLIVAARAAVRRAGAMSGRDGVALGVAAGAVFAALFALALFLSGIGAKSSIAFGGRSETQLAHVGPSLIGGSLAGLVWGLIGGGLGGAAGASAEAPRRARRREEPEESTLELGEEPPAPTAPVPPIAREQSGDRGPTGFEGLAAEQAAIERRLVGPEMADIPDRPVDDWMARGPEEEAEAPPDDRTARGAEEEAGPAPEGLGGLDAAPAGLEPAPGQPVEPGPGPEEPGPAPEEAEVEPEETGVEPEGPTGEKHEPPGVPPIPQPPAQTEPWTLPEPERLDEGETAEEPDEPPTPWTSPGGRGAPSDDSVSEPWVERREPGPEEPGPEEPGPEEPGPEEPGPEEPGPEPERPEPEPEPERPDEDEDDGGDEIRRF